MFSKEGNGNRLGNLAQKIQWMEEPGRLHAVHGVTESRTWLSDFTFTFPFMHWRRKWQPTPVFLPGESRGWGSLVGYRLWGCTELDTTEATQQQQQQLWFELVQFEMPTRDSTGIEEREFRCKNISQNKQTTINFQS